MLPDVIGWVSSLILVVTVGKQVYKQWRDRTSKGVSKWLFIGQMVASLGLSVYSAMVHNWVFVATNVAMLINGILGFAIVQIHRHRRDVRSAG